jgi:hypothetical protein
MNTKILTLLTMLGVGIALAFPVSAVASPDMDFSKANPQFVMASTSVSKLTLGSLNIECMSMSDQGQWTTSGLMNTGSTGKVFFVFKGCVGPSGFSCTSTGAAAGEIKSEELEFHLVYIKGFTHTVGMLFTNNATSGKFASTSCGNLTGNGLIAHLGTPACGSTSHTMSAAFESVASGVSRYQEIEGSETKWHWLAGTSEASADITMSVTLEGEVTGKLTCA